MNSSSGAKRADVKNHLRQVRQQHRQKGIQFGNAASGSVSATGPGPTTLDSSKRARSISKGKFGADPEANLFREGSGKRSVQHEKSYTEQIEEKNRLQHPQ